MEYKLYCLEFLTGVHFGSKNLDSTEITFHADTLFAALFQEALKMEKQKEFLNAVSEGRIVLSDAFPYIGKNYYIPKPMISVRVDDNEKQGNSRQKKMFKNLKYIPVNTVEAFINGTFPEELMEDMQYLGTNGMKVSVGIRGMEEPQPYRVSTYHFTDGSGLYIIAGMESEKDQECLDELFESLQYTGLGGKKSSGMGRFKCRVCDIPREMKEQLTKKASMHLLLSTALPEDEELEDILNEFNSMISLGYSILMNEVYCKIEMKGLNPYFGFIHRDAEKHPTLASDMMEEWRAVIVDATAMSMINGHEIQFLIISINVKTASGYIRCQEEKKSFPGERCQNLMKKLS